MSESRKGLLAAVISPLFLGLAPVLGKFALTGGADPFTVAALRTALVAVLLWGFYLVFWRRYIFIYPAGLIACIAIGFTNGIGSLFYYSGLDLLDASVAQLLNATYVIFVVLLTRMDGTRISVFTIMRVAVAFLGVLLITGGLSGGSTWLGIGLMFGNALLFAGTVVMSQRILYEMPAQTVTLYVMTAMAAVVLIARLIYNQHFTLEPDAAWAIILLALTTALSRLTLFAGVKGVGSLRTALLAIGEGAVAVSLAFLLLDESLVMMQWLGVAALVASLFLPTDQPEKVNGRFSTGSLPNVAGWRFSRMAGSNISHKDMRSMISTLVGSTDKLDTGELNELRRLIGEDGIQKLKELESQQTRPTTETAHASD
ncbi:MAG TPA: DMT family transporter [Aggregatilineales bacterium]|nr:DMT family transporter [Aggregatilineales bacterium]